MKHCIPDELFNRITFPADGTALVGIDGICREILYKLPKAEDVEVRREAWHAMCDFCARTGAYLIRVIPSNGEGRQVSLVPQYGKFLRVVGAEVQAEDGGPFVPTADFEIVVGDGGHLYATFPDGVFCCAVTMSVRPAFDDATADTNGDWAPKVPRYVVDRYGECVAHGALARLYMMRGQEGLARMHATAHRRRRLVGEHKWQRLR